MSAKKQLPGLPTHVTSRVVLVVLGAITTFALGWAAQNPGGSEVPAERPGPASTESRISEVVRSSIKNVVVIAGHGPPNQAVTGSYEKETAGLVGGMDAGSRMGTITKEIGGVPVYIPIIPGLMFPGMILGGLAGATQQEIQEFRDRLTEEIASADSPPLKSDGLALDVFWGIRRIPNIKSQLFAPTVEISNETDAVLYVSFDDLSIEVEGNEAIITVLATAMLRELKNRRNVYQTVIRYQDRDTLKNWTRDENALWRSYTNFARFYLGREIAADVFDRVEVSHELRPTNTATVKQDRKDDRKFNTHSLTPTLAWDLTLNGGDSQAAWTDTIDEANIFYDIEIFDNRQLVYYEEQVPDPSHTVAFDLDPCQTYRWSVRPVYHVNGETKFGDRMRLSPESTAEEEVQKEKGIFGRQASVAPAYIQDFPILEIDCRRR